MYSITRYSIKRRNIILYCMHLTTKAKIYIYIYIYSRDTYKSEFTRKTHHRSHSRASHGVYIVNVLNIVNDDVMEWKHFPRYWPFLRGILWSLVITPHKGLWRGALMFNCASTNGWVNNKDVGDLRRNRAHYDVTVIWWEWPHNWLHTYLKN